MYITVGQTVCKIDTVKGIKCPWKITEILSLFLRKSLINIHIISSIYSCLFGICTESTIHARLHPPCHLDRIVSCPYLWERGGFKTGWPTVGETISEGAIPPVVLLVFGFINYNDDIRSIISYISLR